ncbi:hypothetical protein AJ78_01288 [Emergomyces pasteurianus Ep9510]|uniref:ABM domain-containing protein n=1 Tax=Emergomyces pasteurianus Ep9510 TaxID=1447872 RepID=A0A1J9PQF9_9EURO|nr:hypothetical protein AJ78_01288 [Emergomyces pasteurianus Ep9510]
MASNEVHLIATLKPLPGKMDELVAAFAGVAKKIHDTEPGTLTWYAVQAEGGDELIVVERYKDAQALQVHSSSGHLKSLSEALGPVVAGPPVIKKGPQVAGFRRDEKL